MDFHHHSVLNISKHKIQRFGGRIDLCPQVKIRLTYRKNQLGPMGKDIQLGLMGKAIQLGLMGKANQLDLTGKAIQWDPDG